MKHQPAAETTVCARCDAVAEGRPLTWLCAVKNGRRIYLCDACGRENIRSIESRLDPEWW